jgi:hypothetical protein
MASQPTASQYLHTWHFKGEEGRHAYQGEEEEATSVLTTAAGLGVDVASGSCRWRCADLVERKPADLERKPADLERTWHRS